MEAPLLADTRTPFLINIFLYVPSSLYLISYRISALPLALYIARRSYRPGYHGLQNVSPTDNYRTTIVMCSFADNLN